jgi:hypothetical protein
LRQGIHRHEAGKSNARPKRRNQCR